MDDRTQNAITAVCITVVFVAMTVAGYHMYVTQQIAQLVKDGVPPIEARCAVAHNSATCPNR